ARVGGFCWGDVGKVVGVVGCSGEAAGKGGSGQWCLGSCGEDGWKSWGLVGEVEKQEGRGDKGLQVGRENRLSVQ
nr:hypothetical protein [Tanacetum cinerariifolium]